MNSSISGARLLCDTLQRLGVECVFGLPGTQNLALFEALRSAALRTVVATSELSAAMMANGYYRSSGRVGVLVTIPGPGFTWALTGLAEAALDSAALLHVTGLPAESPGRRFQLQAIDQTGIATPIVKTQYRINRASDVATVLAAAYRECHTGEPGPVLLQVAQGVWTESAPAATSTSRSASATSDDPAEIEEVAALLAQAKRCTLLLGQGCHDAADLVVRLAERLGAAVVTTTSGRGVVPEDHPLSLGFELGGHGVENLNALIDASDRVLAIGCKFSHNASRGFRLRIPADKLIHVDASTSVLGANFPARRAIHADARTFLATLLPRLDATRTASSGFAGDELAQWRERGRAENLQGAIEPRMHGVSSGKPQDFFGALRRAMSRESCLVTDSGRHQELARRHFRVLCPRGLMTPTNLQSMGFGIGAAIGACLANPDRPVVALIGDGGLMMSGLELLTAVRECLHLTVIVFVDGVYGLIRDQQLAATGHASGTAFTGPDCAALATAIGAAYVRLDGDPETTLRAALAAPGVTLVEVGVGDTLPMHWMRAKGAAKNLLGAKTKSWLRRMKGHSQDRA